jgi:CRP/FNR family transcriptional regulator, cyclic AMP receptor protein
MRKPEGGVARQPSRRSMTKVRHGSNTLAQIPLFRSLDVDSIRQLNAQCSWQHAAAKHWLVERGDPSTDVFFLTNGLVRAMIATSRDRDVIFTDLKAGEFFGELAAIDGKPRSAGIWALTQATIARMPASLFREVFGDYADVNKELLKVLAARIRALTVRVHEFSALHVKHRIYAELVRISRPAPNNSRQAVISPPPTHAELAARVSTRREMVTRELKALERANMLLRRRGALVLTNMDRLLKLQSELLPPDRLQGDDEC